MTRLLPISLAIHGLLDQQTVLRTGGLYWVTVDQPTDARRLTQQFIEALPQGSSAALICSDNAVQDIVSDLAPDLGPDTLKLFDIAGKRIESALAILPHDLGRIGIKPDSQVVLLLPASSWADASALKLQRWCERLHLWLKEHNATLLVITHGEATHLHTQLLQLNETLSGLSHLYRHNGNTRYQLHFWHNELGVSAGQEFMLTLKDRAFALVPKSAVDTQPRVADDQHVYLAERSVLEGTPSLSKHWYLFESRESLLREAQTAHAATVIVGIDNSHQLLDLAQQLHDLREKCGPALKIVVRELEPAVRYRDERLLLACGVNLIVPDGTLLSRFLSLIESVQGQYWQYSQSNDFATLLERQRPPDIRGLVSPREFLDAVAQIVRDSTGDVTHQLVRFIPVQGLSETLFLNQMCLRRFGDFACLVDGDLYLFLFACRPDGLEPALGNICRLPWRDLFRERDILNGPSELPEAAFLQAGPMAEDLSIPVDNTVVAAPVAGSRPSLTPQRTTLPLRESQP